MVSARFCSAEDLEFCGMRRDGSCAKCVLLFERDVIVQYWEIAAAAMNCFAFFCVASQYMREELVYDRRRLAGQNVEMLWNT